MDKSIAQLSRGFTIDRTLMRSWKRLVEWRGNDREVRRIVDAIEDAKRKWIGQGKKRRDLLEGRLLKDGRRSLKDAPAEVFGAKGFIRKSLWWRRSELVGLLVIPLLVFGIPAEYFWREEVVKRDYKWIDILSNGDLRERAAVVNLAGGCWANQEHTKIPVYLRERFFGNCRSLRDAKLNKANLRKVNLSGAILWEANLSEAIFEDAILMRAELFGTNLEGTNFSHANLSGVSLLSVKMDKTFLGAANLSKASLSDVDLSKSELSNINLSEARLRDVNFRETSLNNVNLQNAYFSCSKSHIGENGVETIVYNCPDLQGVKWNNKTNWEGIQGWETVENIPPALKQQLGLK